MTGTASTDDGAPDRPSAAGPSLRDEYRIEQSLARAIREVPYARYASRHLRTLEVLDGHG